MAVKLETLAFNYKVYEERMSSSLKGLTVWLMSTERKPQEPIPNVDIGQKAS